MWRLFFCLILVCPVTFAKDLNPEVCRVAKEWKAGKFFFRELCDRYPGNFCLGLSAEGKAMCKEGGGQYCDNVTNSGQAFCIVGQGTYCSSVKNLAQGICSILGEGQCLLRSDLEDRVWVQKLYSACSIP